MKPGKLRFTPLGRVLFAALLTTHVSPWTVKAKDSPANRPDEHALLAAIAEVETGVTRLNRPCRKIGRGGERGPWQMTAAVWALYSAEPFERASSDTTLAHLVASLHLRSLRIALNLEHIVASPHALALAWNAGLTGMKTPTPRQRDYADRVLAIYADSILHAHD